MMGTPNKGHLPMNYTCFKLAVGSCLISAIFEQSQLVFRKRCHGDGLYPVRGVQPTPGERREEGEREEDGERERGRESEEEEERGQEDK